MKILNRRSSPVLALAVYTTLALHSTSSAAPAATSRYYTDAQSTYVEDQTSKGVGTVNMITCIMSALKPDALVNQGSYNALIDEAKCDSEGRASSSNAGANGAAPAVRYMTGTVNSTRASNSEPMISRIWLDQEEEGQHSLVNVRVAASLPPTAANPYGTFRLDYCVRSDASSGCESNGYLEGSDAGIRYFENEIYDEGNGPQTHSKALRLNASGTTAGSGRMSIDSGNEAGTFDFAYNESLFRRSDGTTDQCFSRDAGDSDTGQSVWRYGLYDANTGEPVTRNSGFPIEYTDGSATYRGYLGYYGLSLPAAALESLTSGSTIQKVDYGSNSAPSVSNYSVVKAAGKLTKYTLRTRTLHELDKIKFTTFVGNEAGSLFAGAAANTQYEMYWDDAAGVFRITGQMNCSQNGCQTVALPSEQSVTASFWQNHGLQGWSQSLGGELFIHLENLSGPVDSNSVTVAYRTQDLVYPSQLPETLYCVRDCPTAATLATYFAPGTSVASPFVTSSYNNFSPTAADQVVTYHGDSATALLRDAANQAVTFSDAAAFGAHPQYQYGVRSGRLFTDLATAECSAASGTYCDWKVNSQDVYYQWETGPGSYNQFAAVKDSNGEFVAFDAPLQVTFTVPSGTAYGAYAGQSIVLQYGGYGDLWGIPGECVSRATNEQVSCEDPQSRYVPAFVIPFDTQLGRVTAGNTSYLVKWLNREIRFARKDLSVCTGAGLALPAGMVLPTAAELKNPADPNSDIYIGAKPTVSAPPRVIHGEVKY